LEQPRRLAPSVFLLARGTRLAADITGGPSIGAGLEKCVCFSYPPSTAAIWRGAQVLKPLLERVLPIELEIEQTDPSVYSKRFRDGDYDTRVGGSGADIDPNDSIRDFFITNGKFNTFGYSNFTVDAIVEEQFRESDQERRKTLVHLAEDMVMADAAMAFTPHLIEYVAVRKEVQNFRMSPTPTWDFSQVSMG